MTEAELVLFDESKPAWERAFYAFLAEKERRSGSKRTVDAYSRTLQRFFGTLGKPPDQVTSPEVFAFAHGRGPSGKEPASVTIGARLACVSSFYRFLIRMKIVSSNPCDEIERPRVSPAPPPVGKAGLGQPGGWPTRARARAGAAASGTEARRQAGAGRRGGSDVTWREQLSMEGHDVVTSARRTQRCTRIPLRN